MAPIAEPVPVETEHEGFSTFSDQHSSPPSVQEFKTQKYGYPSYLCWVSDQDDDFPIYRRYGFLRARLSLYREQKITFLEEDIRKLEKMEETYRSRPPLKRSPTNTRADYLTALDKVVNTSSQPVTYLPYDKDYHFGTYASVRNRFYQPREVWSSPPKSGTSVLDHRPTTNKAGWNWYSTNVQRDILVNYMLGGDGGGQRHAGCFNSGYPDHNFGGNMYGKGVTGKRSVLLSTLAMLSGSCAGMLFSSVSFPGGMRTVTGVISTSAAVANVPLHMRSDYNRLRWSVLGFCVVFYGSFLTFLWLSLKGTRRPAYLFFTFLSGAGFIGSALVADKVEDTVNAILTLGPLVATLSAGLLYMPFRYGFGIGANPIEDVELQPQHHN